MAQIKKLKQGETTIFPMTDASAVQYAGKTLSEMTGGGVYSTQPVKIGTWINGETIYRQVIPFTKLCTDSNGSPDDSYIKDNLAQLDSNFDTTDRIILGVTILANGNYYDVFSNNSKDINYILYYGKDKDSTDYFNQPLKYIIVTYIGGSGE